jgi:2-polyprenyl-3-methyl-5-hydroxy-6-metoxy-1,4-benzoquinol methylase
MSKENKKTLDIYKKTAHLYLANSAEHDRLNPIKAKQKCERLRELIKTSFSSLPEHAKVFEIGSGDGTNAKFMESLGFEVTASDTVDGFIEATKKQGLKTIPFNAIEDEFPEKYFGIFCWRVFVHFTKEDASNIIKKIYNVLENDGVFIFNAINAETKVVTSEWIDFEGEYHMGAERYYHYFYQKELDAIIQQTKFKIQYFRKEGGEGNNKWLVYVLRK